MEEASSLIESYMTLGALGVSFLTLIGIIVVWVKSIGPSLQGMREALEAVKNESVVNSMMLNNNNKALETVATSVKEVAKSNENVANMVHILANTLETQVRLIEKHDLEADKKITLALEQLRIYHTDTLRVVEKCGESSDKQHADIVTYLTRHDDRSHRIETELGRVKGKVEIVQAVIERRSL